MKKFKRILSGIVFMSILSDIAYAGTLPTTHDKENLNKHNFLSLSKRITLYFK